jgi:hypothetical protein
MSEKLTPDALYKFFSGLDPGDATLDEGEEEIHYGSPTVLKRALIAAKMLIEVQEALGVKSSPEARPTAEVKEMPGEDTQKLKATQDALNEAESEVDRLLMQNVELKKENEALKERVKRLQRQVERLYNKSELASLLGRLDPAPQDKSERPAAEPSPVGNTSKSEPPPKAEEPASEETTDKLPPLAANEAKGEEITDVDKEIADLADAKRVPPEEREKKESGAESAGSTGGEEPAKKG